MGRHSLPGDSGVDQLSVAQVLARRDNFARSRFSMWISTAYLAPHKGTCPDPGHFNGQPPCTCRARKYVSETPASRDSEQNCTFLWETPLVLQNSPKDFPVFHGTYQHGSPCIEARGSNPNMLKIWKYGSISIFVTATYSQESNFLCRYRWECIQTGSFSTLISVLPLNKITSAIIQ